MTSEERATATTLAILDAWKEWKPGGKGAMRREIEKAITAAEEAEREACAKVADERRAKWSAVAEEMRAKDSMKQFYSADSNANTALLIAAAIRARSKA